MIPMMSKCSIEIPNIDSGYRITLRSLFQGLVILCGLCMVSQVAQAKGAKSEKSPHSNGGDDQSFFHQITGKPLSQVTSGRNYWDQIYSTERYIYGTRPADFLVEVLDQLRKGLALDIAMGEGRNAVYLAKKGFKVEGVDYSDVAIRKAHRLAKNHRVAIHAINADLNDYQIKQNHYDLIININYLQRSLAPMIKAGLKSGGFLVFENQTVDQLKNPGGQGINQEYLLKKGELREMFADLKIIAYRETNDGKDALASLLAQKP